LYFYVTIAISVYIATQRNAYFSITKVDGPTHGSDIHTLHMTGDVIIGNNPQKGIADSASSRPTRNSHNLQVAQLTQIDCTIVFFFLGRSLPRNFVVDFVLDRHLAIFTKRQNRV